jgi:ABC-type transport system involved in multi-copper enzyme maturation permease subunit
MGRLERTITFLHGWVGDWLTPYWIICLGVAAGLLVLVALWGLAVVLSKVPGLGTLSEKPGPRTIAALLVGAAIFAVVLPLAWPQISDVKQAADRAETVGLWLGLLAVASTLAGFAAVMLVGRRAVSEVPLAIKEGVLWPIFVVFLALGAFGILGVTTVQEPLRILASLGRLTATGFTQKDYDIPAVQVGENEELPVQEIPVFFHGNEVERMAFDSDEQLDVSVSPFAEGTTLLAKVEPQEQYVWLKVARAASPLPAEPITKLFVRNRGQNDARLKLAVLTAPPYPEIAIVPLTAAAVCVLFLAYLLQRALMPKISAIAHATAKSEIAQPMFLLLLIGGIMLMVAFFYLPYNTFGEDIKMVKESGIMLILVLSLIQAIWAASNSVSEEIEGRTALTVLSKPIGRREFILGKYVGILWTVLLLCLLLGLAFLVVVGFKPVYDARESSVSDLTWQQCYSEMMKVVPGVVLAFMEVSVLAAMSVAISTRLPMLANFLICFGIWALGHLAPLIMLVSLDRFEIVAFFGQFIATVFPVLDHFSISAAVAGGATVPLEYLGWSLLYCLLYGAMALLLALVMFEDRDLA